MSPVHKKFKVWKVNLVDQPGWKPWDPAGEIAEMSFNLMMDFMRGITEKNDEGLYSLVQDMAGSLYKPKAESGPQEWTPRGQLSGEDIGLISRGLVQGDPGLELTRQLIQDTVVWMYETALTPSDQDARDALIDAKRTVEDNFDLGEVSDPWDLGYDNLWTPLLETGITLNGILSEMLGMGISYSREEGHYDRFLEFDLNKSSAPSELLVATPKKARAWAFRSIEFDWKRIGERIVEKFFEILKRDMSFVDPGNRTSWRQSWKTAIKTTDLKPIQKEMLDYVREIRKQEGSLL